MNNNSPELLSLFSGGGLLDIGFLDSGFSIKQAVEINPFFIEGYNNGLASYIRKSQKAVFRNTENVFTEIAEPLDASSKFMHKHLGKKFAGISGIIGGPPCQDYSIGGKNAGLDGERGKLIFSYLEIVKKVSPQFIFFENVAGLYNTKMHQPAFLSLLTQLRKAGYVIWFDILNSLHYGIPQDRPRIALVGFRKEYVTELEKRGFTRNVLKEPNKIPIFQWPTVKLFNPRDIKWPTKWEFGSEVLTKEISNIPEKYQCLQVVNAFSGLTDDTPNQFDFFQPKSEKFNSVKEGDTNRKSFKRLHRFRFSPTVAYGNNEVHLHPTEVRRLTVREALRLQSVPDSYILPNSIPLTHKFKLISNGVPVKEARLLASSITRTLSL